MIDHDKTLFVLDFHYILFYIKMQVLSAIGIRVSVWFSTLTGKNLCTFQGLPFHKGGLTRLGLTDSRSIFRTRL